MSDLQSDKILANTLYIYLPSIHSLHILRYNFDKPLSRFHIQISGIHTNIRSSFHFHNILYIHHHINNNFQKNADKNYQHICNIGLHPMGHTKCNIKQNIVCK